MNVLTKVVPVFMLAMISILILGLISINLEHHINLPKELLNRNTIKTQYILNTTPFFLHKQYDIYLVDSINSYRQTQDIIETINEAKSNDIVVLHLAGYGGGVEQVVRIINAMLTSKADIITRVEAPVYSGHAYIALYGKTMIILPYTYIMLHTSSALNEDCSKEKGVDRAQTAAQSCQNFKDNHMILVTNTLLNMPFLTNQEKVQVMTGYDLYLQNTSLNTLICKDGICHEASK